MRFGRTSIGIVVIVSIVATSSCSDTPTTLGTGSSTSFTLPASARPDSSTAAASASASFQVTDGFRGADLDAAGGGAPSGIPMSALLAGYVRGVQTSGAERARTILAGQDLTHPDGVVFPTAVLLQFADDAVAAFAEPDAASTWSAGRLMRSGICSDVTKSIFDAVEQIFSKIHIPPGRVGDTGSSFLNGLLQGLTDVVVGTMNFVIDAARTLILDGIKYVLDQLLSAVATVAAAAALIGNFVAAVRPWRLAMKADASAIAKDVDPVYDAVTATAVLIGPNDEWPDWFADCAQVAGVTLPPMLPIDAAVTWTVFPDPTADLLKESADRVKKDVTMRKEGGSAIARIGLVTGTETAEQVSSGQEQHAAVTVSASARRNQIVELRKTLVDVANALAGKVLQVVPAVIRSYLLKLVAEAAGGSTDQVASLLDASATVLIDVTHHGAPRPPVAASVSPGTANGDAYCTLFISFANWSLANLESIMNEASEPTFVVRDAYFTEYLQRMSAMQLVEPVELHDALATFASYAQLYLSHDLAAVAAQASAMGPAAALINGYGRTVCGYDPAVTTG
ncbi:MAG: hypothetical protein JWN99_1372 [Ilumatobacteraceae bacterium]|nr:hypothetical protein [Ilumatobacteraceae bacterium]